MTICILGSLLWECDTGYFYVYRYVYVHALVGVSNVVIRYNANYHRGRRRWWSYGDCLHYVYHRHYLHVLQVSERT